MWYSLRLDGMACDPNQERSVHFLAGSPSLEGLLQRMCNRIEEGVDETAGKLPSGLMAALAVQLNLSQWVSWSAFSKAERVTGAVHPSTSTLQTVARYSMRPCRPGERQTESVASPPSSPSKQGRGAGS